MEYDVLLWFGIAWFIGGFVNSITGFGAAMVAMPLVTMAMDLQSGIAACALMVISVSFEQVWRYGKSADWKRLMPLLIGAFPGVLGGMLIVHFLSAKNLQIALGIFLVFYAMWGLWGSGRIVTAIHKNWGYVAGFFSTTIGIVFSFNGVPLGIYTSLSGWSKQAGKAGLAVSFIVTGFLVIIGQIVMGLHGMQTILPLMTGIPAAVLGAWLGFGVSEKLTDGMYRCLLFSCLGISGIIFSYKGIMAMI